MTKRQREKIHKVMREWKAGKLRTRSGKIVKKKEQALAIAISKAMRERK